MLGLKTSAGTNDISFQQADINYMGTIATAMSLSLWQKATLIKNIGVSLSTNTISIAEVLSNPLSWQQKLIGSNMLGVSSYANVLSTDIPNLLDNAIDRRTSLNEHISLLKSYYNRTLERLSLLNEQIADLRGIISESTIAIDKSKWVMQRSYDWYDYSGVDKAIDTYIWAKNTDTRAQVYLVYLEKFKKSYTTLQIKNLKLIDTLENNKDALIKRSTVVIPNSGSELIKTLKLIQTESEFKTEKNQQQ